MIRIVIERELRTRLRSGAFRVSIGLTVLIVLAGATAIRVFAPEDETQLGLLGDNPPAAVAALTEIVELSDGTLVITEFDTRDDAVAAIEAGEVEGVVVDGAELLVERDDPDLLGLVSPAWQQANLVDGLSAAGLSDADIADTMVGAAPLTMAQLEVDPDREARQGVAFASVVVLFITIQMTGAFIMMSVMEEKSSKVVELLLSSISSRDLLVGKLIGSGIAGLAQMAVVIVSLVGAAQILGSDAIPEFSGWMIVAAVVCYLIGYLLYGSMFAAGASLVSRQEDAQTAMTPVTVLVLLGYIASVIAAGSPDSAAAKVITLVPFVVPFALPGRIAIGNIAAWEVALGLAGAVAMAVLILLLAARIYTRSVMHTDRQISWREAWNLRN